MAAMSANTGQTSVGLPLPIVGGEAKTLEEMNSKELECLLGESLRANGYSFSNGSQAPWWPRNSRRSALHGLANTNVQYRNSHIRDLLRLCYKFYKQEEKLNIFDYKNGECPWYLQEERNDNSIVIYRLLLKESGREVCRFASHHTVVLPLLALVAKQRELHGTNGTSQHSISTRFRRKALEAQEHILKRRRTPKTTIAKIVLQDVCKTTTPNRSPSVKPQTSILSKLEKQEVFRGSSSNHCIVDLVQTPYVCVRCASSFTVFTKFALHRAICSTTTSSGATKSDVNFLARHLNLIPKTVAEECDKEELLRNIKGRQGVVTRVNVPLKKIVREPLTSELGRILNSLDASDATERVTKYEGRCNNTLLNRTNHAALRARYPTSYRRNRKLDNQASHWRYTGRERREWMRKMRVLSRQKRRCCKVSVVAKKWTMTEIAEYQRRVNDRIDRDAQRRLGVSNPRRLTIPLKRLQLESTKQWIENCKAQRSLGIRLPKRIKLVLTPVDNIVRQLLPNNSLTCQTSLSISDRKFRQSEPLTKFELSQRNCTTDTPLPAKSTSVVRHENGLWLSKDRPNCASNTKSTADDHNRCKSLSVESTAVRRRSSRLHPNNRAKTLAPKCCGQ